MRIRPVALASIALLAVAGCGRDPEGEGEGNNSSSAATVQEPVNEALMNDPQNGVVPLGNSSVDPSPGATATRFPAAFQGRWGMVPNDCDPSRDDAKGLMVVEPAIVRFYESRATLASVRATGKDGLAVRLSFTGEGQSWTSDQRFTLLADGKTLAVEETRPDNSLRYSRCPAA